MQKRKILITVKFRKMARRFQKAIDEWGKCIDDFIKCIYSVMNLMLKFTSLLILLGLLVAFMHQVWRGAEWFDYTQYKLPPESRIVIRIK